MAAQKANDAAGRQIRVLDPGAKSVTSTFGCVVGSMPPHSWPTAFSTIRSSGALPSLVRQKLHFLPSLAHDSRKWVPVFGKDHGANKELERDDGSTKSHPARERIVVHEGFDHGAGSPEADRPNTQRRIP